jgi:hypothetical protein
LLDDLKETSGYRKLEDESLDRFLWRTRFGRGYGPVVRQTAEWMNEWMNVLYSPVMWLTVSCPTSRNEKHRGSGFQKDEFYSIILIISVLKLISFLIPEWLAVC